MPVVRDVKRQTHPCEPRASARDTAAPHAAGAEWEGADVEHVQGRERALHVPSLAALIPGPAPTLLPSGRSRRPGPPWFCRHCSGSYRSGGSGDGKVAVIRTGGEVGAQVCEGALKELQFLLGRRGHGALGTRVQRQRGDGVRLPPWKRWRG